MKYMFSQFYCGWNQIHKTENLCSKIKEPKHRTNNMCVDTVGTLERCLLLLVPKDLGIQGLEKK